MTKTNGTNARTTRKARPKLRVLAGGGAKVRALVSDERILVPNVDAQTGAPLPAWRVARWHLVNAAICLLGEYRRERGKNERAEDFARAYAVAMQLFSSLDFDQRAPRHGDGHAPLLAMAHASTYRLKTSKADAERWLLEKLPKTAAEVRERDSFAGREHEAVRDIAQWALCVLSSQDHAAAAKIHERWGVTDMHVLASPKFWEDVDSLASKIHELLDECPNDLAPAIMKSMYGLLRLGLVNESAKKKARRTRNADT